MPVARKPPWPSLKPSLPWGQPCGGKVPTGSKLVWPALLSSFHRIARQQPGEPVIESPRAMILVAAAWVGVAGRRPSNAAATIRAAIMIDGRKACFFAIVPLFLMQTSQILSDAATTV